MEVVLDGGVEDGFEVEEPLVEIVEVSQVLWDFYVEGRVETLKYLFEYFGGGFVVVG